MGHCFRCGGLLERRMLDGRARLACISAGCDYVHWENPTPVIAGLVELDGNVVLARNKHWPSGVMSVITGFLEQDETPEQAAVREVEEELGLASESNTFAGYYSFFEKNQLIFAFSIKARGRIQLGEELAEYKLVPKGELKTTDFGDGVKDVKIKDWLIALFRNS
ncbi:MAG: NUDIX hydrolase [Gammaproteobacteria bacterium]|nr:NUDIX hydrolase [Gammaproteobacteria bacterium]